MRDDLLEAQASVDWAACQFPSLAERIDAWLKLNVSVTVEETDAPATHNVIVAVEKEPLPLAFNVEVGAYINVIRSSLDILASALGRRHKNPTKPDDTCFPVAASAANFAAGNYKGAKFIKALPGPERGIIEALKPYQEGNQILWSLHQLDIIRKHRCLIGVYPSPRTFSVSGWGDDVVPVATGWIRAYDRTVLALIKKGAAKAHVRVIPHVTFDETGPLKRKPIIAALGEFVSLANSIIKLFDTP